LVKGKGLLIRLLLILQIVSKVGEGVVVLEAEAVVEVQGGRVGCPSPDMNLFGFSLPEIVDGRLLEKTTVSLSLPLGQHAYGLNLPQTNPNHLDPHKTNPLIVIPRKEQIMRMHQQSGNFFCGIGLVPGVRAKTLVVERDKLPDGLGAGKGDGGRKG
jgi:hypothetical protein